MSSLTEQESAKCTPDYWFLPLDGSVPALDSRSARWEQQYGFEPTPYTSHNVVEPLIDGAAYMSALTADFTDMTLDDVLLMIGWRFRNGIKLDNITLLRYALRDLIQKGVDVRALVHKAMLPPIVNWEEHYVLRELVQAFFYQHPVDNEGFVNDLNQMGGVAILDDQLPQIHKMASHHQKAVVLTTNQAYKAYVGGIDLAPDRRDTPDHHKTTREETFIGWHDIQYRIQGAAVRHIWANFADRWNDKDTQPAKPEGYRPLKITSAPPLTDGKHGTHYVQVLRTLACGDTFSFAPDGEQTLRQVYEKAIQQAEHYIYIEDQCLYQCDISDLLKRRLREVRDLKIILVTAVETDLPPLISQHHYYLRDQFFANLLEGGQLGESSRVYAFGLYQSAHKIAPETPLPEGQTGILDTSALPIYVHSKLLLVDDRYVYAGSGNVNWRSFTTDSELGLAIVDEKMTTSRMSGAAVPVCQFAKDLRLNLWAEHLQTAKANFTDLSIDEIIAQFPTQADEQVGHLRPWIRNPGKRLTAESLVLQIVPESFAAFLKFGLEFLSSQTTAGSDPLQSGDEAALFLLQEIDPMSECPSQDHVSQC